ncbi:protein-methionine sulfoxide oxidase mical3a-like isoform X18 [Acipenser ruthenus]|uniref:protein-methionine sulfoxide oxidase mical3a-like isoform X18 n=1 Tax=Acipenser ruthenus TaxID=7906 RepID=UPI00145BC036|nr:protein-methionine sulfoxide oxidase mical3a-like isoform X18 [Acipenser ruthenus]
MGDGGGGGDKVDQAHVLFDRFVQGSTFKGTLKAFQELCDYLELKPSDYRIFYHKLKSKLNYWKAKALWAKLDKRASHKDYKKGRACANSKCLIIGAGPCGLRTAIELCFLGAKVVILEKRDAFSRNNVLHLWPFTIQDLRGLGAKKFYGKFCAGSIDHISIRQLQLMLLKMALLLGVEIHVNIEFCGLIEPPEDQENERIGWRAEVCPRTHPVSELEFNVIIGADGKRNTLPGFRRKEFRGKLAIAITANFINRNTSAEAKVEEISGVAFIFNQKFFQDLREATGVDLENIVYYKDDTHYFVMTAKKQSLLEKGVILHDYADTEMLLSRENVDQEALLNYACEAADFSTNHQLPKLDFAINHYGQPDVAMFDFTCMYASENAALMRERNGHPLLVALVGDSLLEPFWPMGTGIARGFLAAMDSAWMVRSWAQGNSPLEVLAERESIYRLLPQTTPENVSKNFSQYSVNPTTRYPNISLHFLRPNQVRHLVDTGDSRDTRVEMENAVNSRTPKLMRNESVARSNKLLNWCQRQSEGFRNVNVTDLTMSWKSGLALCAIIHRYRPDLIDFDSLEEQNMEKNNQLAFDVAEREFGISPIMTGKEMASVGEPDKLSMVMYLTQFYEMFKDTLPPGDNHNLSPEDKAVLISNTKSPISFLSKLGQSISRKRNPKDKKEKEVEGTGKRRKTSQSEDEDPPRGYRDERAALVCALSERKIETGIGNQNKVKSMATQLLAKFEENAPAQSSGLKRQGSFRREFPQNIGGSDVCFFCRKRVYVMERLSAEGKFFHRSCFKCDYCNTTLRLSSYAFDVEDGKFYCKPHYCYRLSGYAQRKRPAEAPLTAKENKVSLPDPVAADGPVQANATATPTERTPAVDVNGVEEPALAKRLRGTPERIELENYRLSLQREEELEEVPEETLAEHNLSSVLDKGTDAGEGSSSSESEMDEVEEEGEDEDHPVSDLGGVPWKQAVQLHARLKGKSETQIAAEEEARALGEEEEEDEDDDEEEKEEEEESSEAGNLRIQQVLQPVDPLEIQADVHWTHICSEQEKERAPTSQPSPSTAPDIPSVRHEAVRAWLETVSGALCEENELEVGDEPGVREEEPEVGTELDEDDIPSDAEAEARMHRIERKEQPPEEEGGSEGRGRVSSLAQSSVSPVRSLSDVLLSPVTSIKDQDVEGVCETLSPASLLKSPGARFFQEPYLPKEGKEDIISETPEAKTLISPTLPFSPIRFQPLPLPEAVIPKSPVKTQPLASPPATSPVCAHSPICSQPLPSTEPSSPVLSGSPVRTQPLPAVASTPLVKPVVESETLEEQNSLSPSADDHVKKTDIIEEFWVKSAEIRKSLGLTPLDRSKGSENSFPESTPESSPPRSDTPEELSEEHKLYPSRPQPALRRLNIATIDRHHLSNLIMESPSEKELKSSDMEKDVGSSSGLGLNGSMANTQTLTSESFNTSESTMLTPPSSPPPPPPENEEPATLRRNKYQASWSTMPEPTPVPAPVPQKAPAAAPTPAPSPVPPQTHSEFRQEPSRKSREEVRKSFVESVDEIPFADDVEDTCDDRTPDTSFQEKFYTPPTSKPKQEKPLFHMALAMDNGKLNLGEGATSKRQRAMPAISPEAKEIAEERMRAREKSVKSQALKDAMAKQLTKMKEMEAVKCGGSAQAVWNVESSRPKVSPLVSKSNIPSAVKSLESRKHEKTADKFLSPPGGQSLEGSVSSSEGSTSGKSKKRTSLFSPRKNKKEKKPKSEGRLSDKHSSEEAAKPKSLWKTVFSGYKKKKEGKSCPSTPSSVTTVDSGKKGASPVIRAAELHLRRHLSFSEDSDLSCDDVLERSSQKSKTDSVYVPHALAFKRSYASKKTYTEEELNAKITRRVQKAARRQAKQEELKRLHRAQIIQRQLEQVEEKQRQLEERGVAVEKALRGEADYWGESNYSEIIDLHLGVEPNVGTPRRRPISFCHCCTHEGMGKKDDPKLMQEWFKLVQEKNALVRYESELMIFARELELEDRQSRLQQELRERMAVDDHLKTEEELAEEKHILNEMLEVVEQRDSLVALLEEQRLSEREEDKDLEEVMLSKGFNLNWS